jgi:hypothetical protein
MLSKIKYFWSDLKTRIMAVAYFSDMWATRFTLALGAIFWGIMLFWPGETFDRPTYTLMAKFAPEWTWAGLFLIQGLYAMYDVLCPGNRGKFTLFIDAILGCVLWTLSCICMLLSVYPPPAAIAGEIALALASWWNLVRFNITKTEYER